LKASVIISTYKRANSLLSRSVHSLLNQTSSEIDIIIIDDNGKATNSQILTEKLLQPFIISGQVQYHVLEENKGACFARNYGAEKAQGDLLFFLDDDDEFLPNKIAVQSQYMQEHPEVHACLAAMFRIDERGRSILSENNQPVVGSFEHYAVKGNFFTPMMCIRKSAYLAIGGMSEIPRFQDRYFMLKCLQANYKVDCLETPLHIMYEHGANRISNVGAQKTKQALKQIADLVNQNIESAGNAFKHQFAEVQLNEMATTYYNHQSYTQRLAAFGLWFKAFRTNAKAYYLGMAIKSLWPFQRQFKYHYDFAYDQERLKCEASFHRILWINHNSNIYKYQTQFLYQLLEQHPDLKIDVYCQSTTNFQMNIWHFMAYAIDKRLYQYKHNPFEESTIQQLNHPRLQVIEVLPKELEYDWGICSVDFMALPERFKAVVRHGVLQWTIPQKQTQIAHLFSQRTLPLLYKWFSKKTDQVQYYQASNIKLNEGIINAYEKFAWYSSIQLLAFFKGKTLTPIKLPKDQLFLRYLKLGGLYASNALYLLKRRIYQPSLNWRLKILDGQAFVTIDQPKNTFWADPFPIQKDGTTYVFYEFLNPETPKGEIDFIRLNENNAIVEQAKAIHNATHFSFPNVFEREDAFFMLPENSQSGQLNLYKAEQFPHKWNLYKTLIDNIHLLDPVWVEHNGMYYIFANEIHEFEYENNNSLNIYFSEDLFSSNWTPHPMNPVVTDAQFARNAGRIINNNGTLFRVSQNCAKSYGAEVNLMAIKTLNTSTYEEILYKTIKGPSNSHGLHTYNLHNDIAWVDVLRRK
jgi:glycosyltransferase involved in cell wall biosynthesis